MDKNEEKEKKVIAAQISKIERAAAKDGSGYVEKSLLVQGKELSEVEKAFDKRWKDE